MTPGLLDIYAARKRLRPYLQPTPLLRSAWLSHTTGATVYLKVESLQPTGSFKIRGALNSMLLLAERCNRDGAPSPLLVTASAGNHGRALALAAERLGLRAVVFTPRNAPETKKAAIRYHGAELRDHPDNYDAAEHAAREFAEAEHALYISPYNHPDVIAGAGTAALEILDLLPSFDVLAVPLGGGGLAGGLGLAMKAALPGARVVGVEAAASTPFAVSRGAGRIRTIEPAASLADGLVGNLEPGSMTFDLVERVVDDLLAVEEAQIADAVRDISRNEHLIAEGAGAVATAGVLTGRIAAPGQTVVVMLTGANIDIDKFTGLF